MHTVHSVVHIYCIEYILLLRYNFLFNKQPKLVNSVRNRWSLHHYCHRRMHHRMVKVTLMTWMMALMDPNNLWNLQTKLYRSSSIIARYPWVQEYRKFQHKSWGGSQQLALAVSEVFMKQSNSMLWVFDGFKRKPVDRQNMLNSAGVDPKFMKSSIPSQRDALIRKLCKGLVENVESKLVDCIFNELTKGTDTSAWVLTSTCTGEDKFKAVFKGKTHNVEKICPGILNAIDWLKSMSIAEKARGVKQTQFGTVQFCTTLCSIQWFC